jgi:homoserine dehydrogenase
VEGLDACRKLAILASLMTGKKVDAEAIYTEGITKITTADFAYANAAGMTIRLLARGKILEDGKVLAMVSPCVIDKENPLAMVNDVFNAVLVTGNMLGDAMFYGKGAGKLPTASAVVSDVIECAVNRGRTVGAAWSEELAELADVRGTECAFFIRAASASRKAVEETFAGGQVITVDGRSEDFGYLTGPMAEKEFETKCEPLGDAVFNRIRLG